jgi:hypothetical protein
VKLAAALLALALAPGRAAAGTTFALVVGNDEGLADEPPLAFAESDAALVARALVEMEVAPAANVRLLSGAALPAVTDALGALGRASGPQDTVFLFVSGHGGQDGAHLGGRVWAWADVRRELGALPARLVVGFFDACRSGALVTAKGELVRGPPLVLAVESVGPRGRLLVTSSGASELSYESTLLASSPFAVALRSGLRGAADGDGDGRITLAELYGFVYARTVAATLAAPTGPQHPNELTELRGAGEVVLVPHLGPGRVRRDSAALGACYFLDRQESRVVAELAPGPGAVGLPSGRYVVKCLDRGELRVATVDVGDQPVRLEATPFRSAPRSYALAKGSDAAAAALGVAAGVLAPWHAGGAAALRLDYRIGRAGLSLAPELLLAATREHRSVLPSVAFGAVIPWWRVLGTRLELGVSAGALFGARGSGATVGPFVEIDRPLGGAASLTVRAALFSRYSWQGDAPLGLLLLSAGLRWGGP